MSKKIFRSIFGTSMMIFLAAMIFIMGVLYSYFSDIQRKQLKSETQLAAQGTALSGLTYLQTLSADCRITWIAADGTVRYDSDADADAMENHLARAEVQEALRSGYGESTRYSGTLAQQLIYAAQRLPDGSVIRLARSRRTAWFLLIGFLQPICAVILLALILSAVLGTQLAKKIVAPINDLDLDHPLNYLGKEPYAEIEPLLRRMNIQQTQIRQDQAELARTSQIRQEFTANVSHELKTPLHAISGYAELMENGMVRPEDIQPFAAKIHAESQRLAQLVEDIIDLTQLDNASAAAPSPNMQWAHTDLLRIAENAIDSLRPTADEANVTLSLTGEPAPLNGIPPVLHSIVYNLCDNAIKYNPPGGRVEIRVEPLPNAVRLTVADTGIGIPPECQSRIFERFYRVDKSRSKAVGGTGLGLSIVKHAVQAHHGEITVSSVVGEGTKFEVTLPGGKPTV